MRIFALLIAALIFALPNAANAQAVYSCGIPDSYNVDKVDPDTHDICDIYTRQLDYRLERLALKEEMEERRENYAIARRTAIANYKKNLAAIRGE